MCFDHFPVYVHVHVCASILFNFICHFHKEVFAKGKFTTASTIVYSVKCCLFKFKNRKDNKISIPCEQRQIRAACLKSMQSFA